MKFYIKLAWRNIFRNKRRTIISSIAIGLGLASLIVTDAVMIGMEQNMIRSATASFLGEAQIHANGFRDEFDIEKTINKPDMAIDKIKKNKFINKYSKRTITMGTIKSAEEISPIILFGISPELEQHVSKIDEAVKNGKGEYFKGNKSTDIVIGSKLADKLKVTIGDRIIITVNGSKIKKTEEKSLEEIENEDDEWDDEEGPVEEAFYISGIYSFNINEMDSGMAFIRLNKAQELLNLRDKIHEIAIKFFNIKNSTNKGLSVWNDLSINDNEIVGWDELLPQLKAVFDMTGISLFVTALILFVMITFGIINTLFMSLFERMFELGVLRAVGTRPSGIRKLLLFEAGALSIVSIIIGLILGYIITYILTKTGIDYRGIEMAGTMISDMIYPVFSLRQFILYPTGVFIFTLIVGMYPAYVAGKMSITKALKKSL